MGTRTFEIGLVGAGAISAGAYTGGVVDFLVQALDSWYAARGHDELAPLHAVKLSTFSGASAGGITAALAAAYLGSDQPPVTNELEAAANDGRNKLFDCWVDRIDIANLLESRDLAHADSPVVSLLDSTVLSEIADSGLSVTPRPRPRPYVADKFELCLTVTNLRGVPYAFPVQAAQPAQYDMSLHADYVRFSIGEKRDVPGADRYPMTWDDFGTVSSIKEKLKESALASGAFPIGLAPRTLSHVLTDDGRQDWYSARLWPVPTPDSTEPHQCVTPRPLAAHWGDLQGNTIYRYQCVDGGVMNNEPFELARQILAGGGGRNPRGGDVADKALLLIDPFPSSCAYDPHYAPAPDLLKNALQIFSALKNQARFKPDELMLAAQADVYSRFMIAPSRDGAEHPIACGALGGFGGFLKRDFRLHDYFLGRRNTQKFLRDHFVLPENNPLFESWTEAMKSAHCVRDVHGQCRRAGGLRLLPIIPLFGAAGHTDCHKPTWPHYTADDLARLMRRVERRVDAVLERLVNQYFRTNNLILRFIARMVLGRKKHDVVEFARTTVAADLRRMGLME